MGIGKIAMTSQTRLYTTSQTGREGDVLFLKFLHNTSTSAIYLFENKLILDIKQNT